MKNIFILSFIVFSTLCFAQNGKLKNKRYFKITQNSNVNKKGFQIVLKKVLSDSRCPEGVSCIWAGETKVLVTLYQDQKNIQDETITITPNLNEENIKWFSKYLPSNRKKIKSISVFPYPKQGRSIAPKDYYIKIEYEK